MKTIRELLSRPLALSGVFDFQLYIYAAGLSAVTSMLLGADFSNPEQWPWLLVANLLSLASLAIVVFVAKRALESMGEDRPPSIAWFVWLGLCVGFLKGAVTGLAMFWLFPGQGLLFEIASRAWQTSLVGMVTLPALALLGTLRVRYREDRKALISEKVAQQTQQPQSHGLSDFVASARDRIASIVLEGNPEQLAHELRKLVQDELRPLSHKIWQREAARIPSYSFREILATALSGHAYRPTLVVALYLLTVLVPSVLYFGLEFGLAILALRGVWLFAVLSVAQKLNPSNLFGVGVMRYLVVILTIIIGHELIGFWIRQEPWSWGQLGLIATSGIWLIQLTLSSGMTLAFIAMGTKVERELSGMASQEQLSLQEWTNERRLRDRELAQFLHGHLQGQLVSAAMRLESSPMPVGDQLKVIDQVLQDAMDRYSAPSSETLDEVVAELRANWSGIVNLTFSSQLESLDIPILQKLSQVLNEGITNAVRHGFASEVIVELQRLPIGVAVLVTDNGTGPRDGAAGLGSYFFDSVSDDWSLERAAVGARLRVVFSD